MMFSGNILFLSSIYLTMESLHFQYQLRRASLTEEDAFAFLKADSSDDYISYSDFCEALRQVVFTIQQPNLHICVFIRLCNCVLVEKDESQF